MREAIATVSLLIALKYAFTSQRPFYTAACLHGQHHGNGDVIASAFPNTDLHRKYPKPLEPVLDSLGITVYFVRRDRSVLVP